MVLITGASSGIGEACAELFAKEGHALLLVARRKERLEALAQRLRDRHRVEVHALQLDVSDRKAVEGFAQAQAERLGQVTVLVNNAGLARGLDPIQTSRIDDWEEMIDTNVKGLLYMTHALLPMFLKKNGGHIVHLGSVAGRWAYPKGHVYCATKSAVKILTEAMRLDLNGSGIRVTEIAPGMVKTEFSEVRLGDKDKAEAVYTGLDALTATDIAEAVVWCVNRPSRVNIQEMVIYPTDQAAPGVVTRRCQSPSKLER